MEKIKAKIRKLLELSNSDNINESQLAMSKARELLAKHKLEIKDIKDSSDVDVNLTNITYRSATWKPRLAKLIAKNFSCDLIIRTELNTNKLIIVGFKDDVEVCETIILYAIESIETKSKRLGRELNKQGKSARGLQSDYANGFEIGLMMLFTEQDRANEEWGLVMQTPKEVEEKINEMAGENMNINQKPLKHAGAYREGIKDGKNFDISKRIK